MRLPASLRRRGRQLGGEFDECPKLGEVSIIPTDTGANGRFETLRLMRSVVAPQLAEVYPQFTASVFG